MEKNEPKYFITADQFEMLSHFKEMFDYHAELISGLCSSEKDDVVYGFELGKIHYTLCAKNVEMAEFIYKIREQETKN
jgi:hypothetical protein